MRPTYEAFLLLVLFLIFVYSGTTVEDLGNGVNRIHKFQKKVSEIPRMMVVHGVLDYDYAGPNPRHDPTRKRGGNHP
ncbi:unnamed protein product [Withania somnifera]